MRRSGAECGICSLDWKWPRHGLLLDSMVPDCHEWRTSIVPTHDRSLIFSRGAFNDLLAASITQQPSENDDSRDAKSYNDTTVLPSDDVPKADPAVIHKFPQLAKLDSKIFQAKRSAIEDLKREAVLENFNVTTVDLITAHIWRSFNLLPEANRKSSAVVATYMNGRQRFHRPSLPNHYSGNVISFAFTPQVPSAELLSHSPAHAADRVHTAVQAVNPLTWKDYVVGTVKMMVSFHRLDDSQFHITSWHRFPVYDLSFDSSFGKPVYTAWNFSSGYLPLGLGVILPPPLQYSEQTIASTQFFVDRNNGTADALLNDSLFLSMFH